MSIRVVGYRNGRRIVEDEGRSFARVQGYGGSLITHAITPMRSPWSRPAPHKRMLKVNDQPRCGKIMARLREPCFRRAGHRDVCRTQTAVIADTERRRVGKSLTGDDRTQRTPENHGVKPMSPGGSRREVYP